MVEQVIGERVTEPLVPYVPPERIAPDNGSNRTQQAVSRTAEANVAELDRQRLQAMWDRYYNGLSWDGKAYLWVGHFIAWSMVQVGRAASWVHKQGNWIKSNGGQLSKFVRIHCLLFVAPWTAWSRRKVCNVCPHKQGKWCKILNRTCRCGQWSGSALVHVTRLSDIECPDGRWSKGWISRAWHASWSWFRNLTGRSENSNA